MDALPDLEFDQLRRHGRKHVAERQAFLVELLAECYHGAHRHAVEPDAFSFSRNYLIGRTSYSPGLRMKQGGDRYKQILADFFDFPTHNGGYSRDRGVTKPYRLRPHVARALDKVFSGEEAMPVLIEREDGTSEPLVDGLPTNGAPEGVGLFVPSVVPVTAERVDRGMERVRSWIERWDPEAPLDPGKPDGTTLVGALRLLRSCRTWAISLGGLPNLYVLQGNGRLGPPSRLHLVNLPNRIRHLLFEGSGLHDLDLASCHWSIFVSLGRELGFETTVVERYIDHKADWHARWAGITGKRHNAGAFKAVAASWLTGGTLSAHKKTASAQRVGEAAMEVIRNDRAAHMLYGEVKAGMKRVVREALRWQTDGKDKYVTNAVGATMRLERRRSDFGRLCSFVLTGFEQVAVRAACREAEGVQAVIYDGWIAPDQPTEPLEAHMREASRAATGIGLDLRIKTSDLSQPLPDLELVETDWW